MMNSTFRALALAAFLPAVAAAQAIPSPTSAKRAAQNAANKTSAAIAASQNTETQTPAKQPAAPQTKTTTAAPQTKTAAPQTKTATTTPHTKTATPQTKTTTTAPAQTKAAAPQTKAAATTGPQPAARSPQQSPAGPQSAARTPQAIAARPRPEVVLVREVYDYRQEGRRDPFLSLVSSSELRPTISDLKLVAVAHDAAGRNSVAIMRDVKTNEQYRVKVGQTLGRMRVAQIQPKAVVFSIEEFGYNRQEILALGDTTRARTP